MKTLILISVLFVVIGEFVYEGLFHKGLKDWSKRGQTLWLVNFGILWYYAEFSWLLIGIYIISRILFGGIIWNLSAGQKWDYIGIGWYDKKIEPYMRTIFVRGPLLFALIILIIKHFELLQ